MDTIETCRSAWEATKPEHASAYDDLIDSYRVMLAERVEAIQHGAYVSDGPFHNFDQTVQDMMRREGEAKPAELKGKLPEDFPAHTQLHEAGVNTYTQLSKVKDLTEIKGIGAVLAKKIEERLEEDRKALNS